MITYLPFYSISKFFLFLSPTKIKLIEALWCFTWTESFLSFDTKNPENSKALPENYSRKIHISRSLLKCKLCKTNKEKYSSVRCFKTLVIQFQFKLPRLKEIRTVFHLSYQMSDVNRDVKSIISFILTKCLQMFIPTRHMRNPRLRELIKVPELLLRARGMYVQPLPFLGVFVCDCIMLFFITQNFILLVVYI